MAHFKDIDSFREAREVIDWTNLEHQGNLIVFCLDTMYSVKTNQFTIHKEDAINWLCEDEAMSPRAAQTKWEFEFDDDDCINYLIDNKELSVFVEDPEGICPKAKQIRKLFLN